MSHDNCLIDVPPSLHHFLVIGGTGMLSGATRYLLSRGNKITLVSRHSHRFSQFSSFASQLNPVMQDYQREGKLLAAIHESQSNFGPIDRALLWIHETAPILPTAIVKELEHQKNNCDVLHVISSPEADPMRRSEAWFERMASHPLVHYRQVILGFVLSERGSRWLTNQEISNGVIQALDSKSKKAVVGTVNPWRLRP